MEKRIKLKELMDENRQLRNRIGIDVLAKGTEEPKFSTPERHLKKAETTTQEAETTKGKAEKTTKEAERHPKEGESSTVLVMPKLMEGMQALQKQMMDGKDDEGVSEAVCHAPALPSLPANRLQ